MFSSNLIKMKPKIWELFGCLGFIGGCSVLILAFLEDTIGSVTSNDTPTPPNLQPPSLCLYLSSSACSSEASCRSLDEAGRCRGGEDDGANTPSPLSSFSGSQMEACPPKSAYTPPPLILRLSQFWFMPPERCCRLAQRSP